MDPLVKDLVQVLAWLVAIGGGLIAAFKALHETAENRRQRGSELRWKKAQLAREIINGFKANPRFRDALIMLDWSGRDFEIAPGRREEVTWEELPNALQGWDDSTSFTDKEVYIRDCFDELFDGLNLLEHYLETDLLDFADVEFPMEYYIGKLREHWRAVDYFISHRVYRLAHKFVAKFPDVDGTMAKMGSPPTG